MANQEAPQASRRAIKDSVDMWGNFVKISTYCGIGTCGVLIIMALTLV